MNKPFHILFLLCFTGLHLVLFSQKAGSKKIEILGANSLEFDKDKKDAQRLIGNVRFKHDDALMFCDSAYFFTGKNIIEAYGNIKINQGDSIQLRGDSLFYDGNKKQARLRNNITFRDNEMNLTTNYLDYDTKVGVGNYIGGGTITSIKNSNTLSSETGRYNTKSKTLFFKKNVKMQNPEYTMKSDTLVYHPDSEVSRFYGYTEIISKENTIKCYRGWYDSKKEISSFYNGASILSKNQTLSGDSIYYNRNNGIGEAFRNVKIEDTTEKYIIYGNYAKHKEKERFSLVTGKALLSKIMDEDTLHLAGDTITSKEDSISSLIKVFHRVKIYKSDLQGLCDSLTYNSEDSVIRMFTEPVLWSDDTQMTADSIDIFLKNNKMDKIVLTEKAFIISEEDTVGYNQIKGRLIEGFMNDSTLSHLIVKGNGEALYYVSEKEKEPIGLNRVTASTMRIEMKNGKVDLIKFYSKPDGSIIPMQQLTEKDKLLKDFTWLIDKRPQSVNDLFENIPIRP
ncbi:MAG: OstA-like protein [Flavobacteriales bacterium]